MQYTMTSLIILAAVGLLILWMGYRMRFKNDLSLIAGIGRKDPGEIKDPQALCRLMGTSTLFIGLATLVTPVASMYWGQNIWLLYSGLVAGLGITSVIKARKFL